MTATMTSTRTATSKALSTPFQQLVERRLFATIEEALWKEEDDEKLRSWLEDDPIVDGCGNKTSSHTNSRTSFLVKAQSSRHRSFISRMIEETPLHRIAAVDPPASVVEILTQRLTSLYKNAPLDATDALGRTPLHVAVASGSTEIVHLLTYGCPKESTLVTASLIPDSWMRYPLHWACTHSKPTKSMSMRNLLAKVATCSDKCVDMVGAVRILLDVYPEAVLLRDRDGQTPLDLAVESEADARVLKLVYQTTQVMHHRTATARDAETALLRQSLSNLNVVREPLPKGFPEEITLHTMSTATSSKTSSKCSTSSSKTSRQASKSSITNSLIEV